MANTPQRGFRYPVPTDSVDVPRDLQYLALDIENALQTPTPALLVQREWPNLQQDYWVIWAQGLTAYAVAGDYSLRKTTDGGYSWTRKNTASLGFQVGYRGAFLKTQVNTLLTIESGAGATPTIRRSTDDGVTWGTVTGGTFATNKLILSPQSWCQDLTTGYLYLGEYQITDNMPTVTIWRSTDDGATWTAWKILNGPTSGQADRIRHVHACQYDPVSTRVYFMIGDQDLKAGIYRVNSGGTDIEPVLTNDQVGTLNGLGGNGVATARAVAAMFFPNYIAWMTDEGHGNLVRIPRTQIGLSNPSVSIVSSAGVGSGWGTVRCASDGSAWLASTDSDNGEGTGDYAAHLWHVSNDGATVSEVGAMPASPPTVVGGGFVPIGQAELHTVDSVWLGHGFGADGTGGKPDPWQARCVISYSRGALSSRRARRKHQLPTTVSSGVIALTANQVLKFAEVIAPSNQDQILYVIEYGISIISGTGTGKLRLIQVSNSANLAGDIATAYKQAYRGEDEFALTPSIPAGTNVEFRVVETGGVNPVTVNAWVTYAWGPALAQHLF